TWEVRFYAERKFPVTKFKLAMPFMIKIKLECRYSKAVVYHNRSIIFPFSVHPEATPVSYSYPFLLMLIHRSANLKQDNHKHSGCFLISFPVSLLFCRIVLSLVTPL